MLIVILACFTTVLSKHSTNSTSLDIFMTGDWGGATCAGAPNQCNTTQWSDGVAASMSYYSEQLLSGPDGIFLMGDNFYVNGVTSVNDPRFSRG